MSGLLGTVYKLLVGNDAPTMPSLEMPAMPSFNLGGKPREPRRLSTRELIQRESEIGGTLFGEVPSGHRREFFNLDPMTWIWHEEWFDQRHRKQVTTIRYEIHDNGVLKAEEGARYSFLEGQELENFLMATRMYYDRVTREVYSSDPVTGQPLVPRAV